MAQSPVKVDEICSLPEAEQARLLFRASCQGRVDIISRIIQANASLRTSIDAQGRTPLHHAVDCGNMDTVRALLRLGIPADTVAIDGRTALSMTKNAKIRDAFSGELLQSAIIGDAHRIDELIRAGVAPSDMVGPSENAKTLICWAEELLGSEPHNEALLRLRSYAAPAPSMKTEAPSTPTIQANRATLKLEEKDALIVRLRSMLQDMSEEQEFLRRLVKQQGSTTVAEHFTRLKRSITEVRPNLFSVHYIAQGYNCFVFAVHLPGEGRIIAEECRV
jgi:hypothetical protein